MRLYFDGYDIKKEKLDDKEKLFNLFNLINDSVFDGKGKITIVPYFNGKVEKMGGISCLLLGNNFHFTCHTFCYVNTVFIDYYGNKDKQKLLDIILDFFETNNYDLCENNQDKKGKFGKQVILNSDKSISFEDGRTLMKNILTDINMTPIHSLLENYRDENNYDLLQLIAESHIAIHKKDGKESIDVFSCKDFDEKKLLKILNCTENDDLMINRGINFNLD